MSRRLVVGLAGLLALAGCATRDLDVGYPPTAANKALLGQVAPRRVVMASVGDRRIEQSRIGVQPGTTKPIVASRPVPEIVGTALAAELGQNGHQVVAAPGDVVVAAAVDEFWLDTSGQPEKKTQYVGRVAIALVISDARTGERLLERRYVGLKRRIGEADSTSTWREVMDTALARTMRDVATDPDVANALGRLPL